MTLRVAAAASILLCSCALQDSAANPAEGERPEDFSALLQQHASRTEVELTAALGSGYQRRDPGEVEAVESSLLRHGEFRGHPSYSFGNRVCRVSKCEEAARLLRDIWPDDRFLPESSLSQLFRRYPRASVAMMEADDQQILFFDERDTLVAIYPPPGR